VLKLAVGKLSYFHYGRNVLYVALVSVTIVDVWILGSHVRFNGKLKTLSVLGICPRSISPASSSSSSSW